tara:strand:- start:446 stop:658 length:213 start_codon:yes stop_codon:yes gene_type:complete
MVLGLMRLRPRSDDIVEIRPIIIEEKRITFFWKKVFIIKKFWQLFGIKQGKNMIEEKDLWFILIIIMNSS